MGGSGIAGDVVAVSAAPFMSVPVTVVKGYVPPDYVGTGSLVFAISFSGDTEETLEAAAAAYEAGAALVAVTGGGELAHLAADWDVPIVPVPEDIPQPRAALGAMAIPPLVLLESIGLFPGAQQWVDEAVERLRRRRDQLVRPDSVAETVAQRIGRTIPLIHGAQDLGAAAALRWKTQVNENAKSPAFFNVYPELCHNEVAGWGQHGDATRQLITLVNLRHNASTHRWHGASTSWSKSSARWWPTSSRSGPPATASSPSCSTWRSSATSPRCTWPAAKGSTRGPSPCSTRSSCGWSKGPELGLRSIRSRKPGPCRARDNFVNTRFRPGNDGRAGHTLWRWATRGSVVASRSQSQAKRPT